MSKDQHLKQLVSEFGAYSGALKFTQEYANDKGVYE